MSAPRPRARCRVCRTSQRVETDGRIAPHGAPAAPDVECDGAGYLPAQIVGAEVELVTR